MIFQTVFLIVFFYKKVYKEKTLIKGMKGKSMEAELKKIKESVLPAIEEAKNLADLDAIRVGVVGKNGTLTALMKELGALSAEEKGEQ